MQTPTAANLGGHIAAALLEHRPELVVPFPGFYDTWLSEELDACEEQYAEWRADRGHNPAETLDASDIAEAIYWCADYSQAWREIAREYADTFSEEASEELGFDLGLTYSTLVSPREYNFATDRLFARVSAGIIAKLREAANPEILARVIRERHSSRSGFVSFYSNRANEWADKPIGEWDHNELATLLRAALETVMGEEWERTLEDRTIERLRDCNVFDHALDAAIDFPELDRLLDRMRTHGEDALPARRALRGNG